MINQQENGTIEARQLDLEIDATPDLRAKIGRRLGDIRRERKISQELVAQAVHMSRPHLSNVELGRSRAGWSGLKAVAAFYDLDISELAQQVKGLPEPTPARQRTRPGEEVIIAEGETERSVLSAWRLLDPAQRLRVMGLMLDMAGERFTRRS